MFYCYGVWLELWIVRQLSNVSVHSDMTCTFFHIFVFPLLCHLKNTNKNKQLEKTLISDFGNDVMLSDYGQLSQSGPLIGILSMGLPTPGNSPQSPDSVELLPSSRSPDVPLANDSSVSYAKAPGMSVAYDAPAPNPASVQSVTKSIMDGLKRTAGLLTENIQQIELPILSQIQDLFLNILGTREISLYEMQSMTDNMRWAQTAGLFHSVDMSSCPRTGASFCMFYNVVVIM